MWDVLVDNRLRQKSREGQEKFYFLLLNTDLKVTEKQVCQARVKVNLRIGENLSLKKRWFESHNKWMLYHLQILSHQFFPAMIIVLLFTWMRERQGKPRQLQKLLELTVGDNMLSKSIQMLQGVVVLKVLSLRSICIAAILSICNPLIWQNAFCKNKAISWVWMIFFLVSVSHLPDEMPKSLQYRVTLTHLKNQLFIQSYYYGQIS